MSFYQDPFRARPTALLGVAPSEPPAAPQSATGVPEKANDVVAWLRAVDGDEAVARAQAAKAAEDARDEPRKTVLAAIEDVLG